MNAAYGPPVDEMIRAMRLAGLEDVLRMPHYAALELASMADALAGFARLASDVIAPTDRIGDRVGVRLDVDTGARADFQHVMREGMMREGVTHGRIDTVHSAHTPEAMNRPPRVDAHGGEVYVYRRARLPCHICGGEIRTADLAARNLFWCPACQRR